MEEELIAFLRQFISEERDEVLLRVLNQRTRYLSIALEDIYQPHNASAVLRSADCFGIQDVHIIENKNSYEVNPDIALGSSKWLNLYKYPEKSDNTALTINKLRKEGYRIVATSPHKDGARLDEFELEKGKAVLFFGTEQHGLSVEMLDLADEYLQIPMVGFTESFNISVSAAVILSHLAPRLRNSKLNWQLSNKEKQEIHLEWLQKTVKKSDLLISKFLSTKKNI